MARHRTRNREVPADALLSALRQAAEKDGARDVEAVVAHFATYVRAQAPHLAVTDHRPTPRHRRRVAPAATVVATLAIAGGLGAVASGAVANPFERSPAAVAAPDPGGPGDLPVAGGGGTGTNRATPGAGGELEPVPETTAPVDPAIAEVVSWQMVFSDPSTALAGVGSDPAQPPAPPTTVSPTTVPATTVPATTVPGAAPVDTSVVTGDTAPPSPAPPTTALTPAPQPLTQPGGEAGSGETGAGEGG
jgi:hypothetical protein